MKPKSLSWLLAVLLLLITVGTGRTQQAVSLTLDNGMHFVLQENHANPMIASVVAVRVGSRHEEATINGLSHLLEHLLFSGTLSRSRQDISAEIRKRGGYLNAFTRKDATSYILLIPKDFAEEGLEIQGDMIFNSIIPEDELAKERKVVIEEINQSLDNPDYRAQLFSDRMTYGRTSYARPILGFKNIIANLSRQEILDFYHHHYVPNNMVALITGDFEVEKMKELLERLFGSYPSRKLPFRIPAGPYIRPQNQIYYRQLSVPQTSLTITFPGPPFYDPDYYAFDLLTRLLVLDEGSPLNRALKGGEKPAALELSTELTLQEGGSRFILEVILDTDTGPAMRQKVQIVIDNVIEVFRGMADWRLNRQEVLRVLTDLKAKEYRLREKLHYWGMNKAPLLALAGYGFVWSYPEKMERVGPDELVRAAERFFSQPRYVATVVSSQDMREKKEEEATETEQENTRREVLANGLTVIARRKPSGRVFAVHILAKNRSLLEPLGKPGTAELLSRLLLKGTLTRSATQISRELAEIGAEIKVTDNPYISFDDLYTSPAYAYIRFETISEHAEKGLDLLVDLARHPSLDPEEIERVQEDVMRIIARQERNPSQAARQLLHNELFRGDPFDQGVLGTKESIATVSRQDLIGLHRKLYAPNNLIISLVGNFSVQEMITMADRRFGDLERMELPPLRPLSIRRNKGRRATKALDSEQASIRLGLFLIGIESPDAPALQLMTSVLSGRLTAQLREAQGLAYSVGVSAHLLPGFGWLEVSLGTAPQNLPAAQKSILKEMHQLQEAMIQREELERVVNSQWGSLLMRRLSSINQAYYACLHEFLGLPMNFDQNYFKTLRRTTPHDVQQVARKYLEMEEAVIVIVGAGSSEGEGVISDK